MPSSYGPYSGVFRPGGSGLSKPLETADTVLQASSPWSIYCWFQSEALPNQKSDALPTLLAGVGNPLEEYSRYLGIRDGKLIFWMGEDNILSATAALRVGDWHFIAATFDGSSVHLFSDGQEVAKGALALGRVSANFRWRRTIFPGKKLGISAAGSRS